MRDRALNESRSSNEPPSFLISGSTGLVGSAVTNLLLAGGHRVAGLTRKPSGADAGGAERIHWEPESGILHPGDVEGHDVAVHLAGENIAAGPWTATRKARIRDSRVRGTDLLGRALAATENGPRVLVCASAVGFYGHRGDTSVDESSGPGEGFLAQTCVEWEAAAAPARDAGIRVVHLRIGIVLSQAGGALSRMLPQWRLGLGGPSGTGRQFWSWISLDDLVSAILHAALVDDLEGPVNAVAPRAVRNAEFSRTLGNVLDRPAILPVPSLALRLLLGEMADELLLGGASVVPRRLLETGFEWRHPELEDALRHVLGRPREAAR